MNETVLWYAEPAAQYDDDEVLDAWLANLTPDELDRFLMGISSQTSTTVSAYDLPA